jgi:hypothetical protein
VVAPHEAAASEAAPAPFRAAPAEGLPGLAQNKFVWAAAAVVVLMILVLLFR